MYSFGLYHVLIWVSSIIRTELKLKYDAYQIQSGIYAEPYPIQIRFLDTGLGSGFRYDFFAHAYLIEEN